MNPDFPKSPREEFEARLTALLLGQLSAGEASALHQSLAVDPELQLLHDRLKQAIALVRETVISPAQEGMTPTEEPKLATERREKLFTSFKVDHSKELARREQRRVQRRELALLAAMLVGLIALAGIVASNFTRARPAGPTVDRSRIDLYADRFGFDSDAEMATPTAPREQARSAQETEGLRFTQAPDVALAKKELSALAYAFIPPADKNASADQETAAGEGLGRRDVQIALPTPTEQSDFVVNQSQVSNSRDWFSGDRSSGRALGIADTEMADSREHHSANGLALGTTEDSPAAAWRTARTGQGFQAGYDAQPGKQMLGEGALNQLSALPAAGNVPNSVGFFEQQISLHRTEQKVRETDVAFGFGGTRLSEVEASKNSTLETEAKAPARGWYFASSVPSPASQPAPPQPWDEKRVDELSGFSSLGNSATPEPHKPNSLFLIPNPEKIELNRKRHAITVAGFENVDSRSLNIAPVQDAIVTTEPLPMIPRAVELKDVRDIEMQVTARKPAGEMFSRSDSGAKADGDSQVFPGIILSSKSPAATSQLTDGLSQRGNQSGKEEVDAKGVNSEPLSELPQLSQFKSLVTEIAQRESGQAGDDTVVVKTPESLGKSLKAVEDRPEIVSKRVDLGYVAGETRAKQPAQKPLVSPASIPQPEMLTEDNTFSTFSLNVSDVSFKLAAAALEKGQMPDPATVRSEEFINAFDYRDPEPAGTAPIAFAWERARYPFAHDRDLLRFSVKTAASGRQPGRPLNLVLLLDNSGSMERADRIRIRQECLRVLASQLQPQDRVSVVAFARTARLWVDGLPGNQVGELPQRVGGLTPEGGTNLEDAMNLAYQTALRHFLANGVNRVVLLTDGAANLGEVKPESLKEKVETHRQQGVALDCFGIGWDGLNDELLEALSRNGDGRYGFVNTPEAATTEFAAQLAGALKVAASDVKVQVEWNPRRVTAYRQIGYAKHQLKKEQFRDNTVDAAEIGAAEAGNALYTVQVNPAGEGPLGVVRVRFKIPGTSDYREHEWPLMYEGTSKPLDQSSPALRLAASASAFSEWLVSSPFAAEVTPDKLLGYLAGVPEKFSTDPRPKKLEWMIRQAKRVAGK